MANVIKNGKLGLIAHYLARHELREIAQDIMYGLMVRSAVEGDGADIDLKMEFSFEGIPVKSHLTFSFECIEENDNPKP